MIYLDNASTTHKKPLCVLLNVMKAMTIDSVNPGRSGYKLSLRAENVILDVRQTFKDWFNLNSIDDVIFTSGATMSINLGLIGTVKLGGHIVTTIYEHNSVLRTIKYMATKFGVTYSLVTPRADGKIHSEDIESAITKDTYLIVVNHISNVVGFENDILSIGKIAKKYKTLFMVDGAQSVGHNAIDMKKCNINLLSIAGHKGLYAPQGIGVLLIRNVDVNPLIFGGTGTYSDSIVQPKDRPEGLESGTHNLVGIYGLYAGLRFVIKNFDKLNKKIEKLSHYLIEQLKHIDNVKLYSSNIYSGVVSFNIKGKTSSEVSDYLAENYNIATRSGLHCAPLVHSFYGTLDTGMVRVSLSYYNSKRHIDKLLKAVKRLSQN